MLSRFIGRTCLGLNSYSSYTDNLVIYIYILLSFALSCEYLGKLQTPHTGNDLRVASEPNTSLLLRTSTHPPPDVSS